VHDSTLNYSSELGLLSVNRQCSLTHSSTLTVEEANSNDIGLDRQQSHELQHPEKIIAAHILQPLVVKPVMKPMPNWHDLFPDGDFN